MAATKNSHAELHHQQIDVAGLSIHVVSSDKSDKPAILFLHGWPENWALYEPLLITLHNEAYVAAIDLPGIGLSTPAPKANDTGTLAKTVRGVIKALDMQDVTLVGHDAGGMIVYAYLHAYPGDLSSAVIMNTAIPGVDPWDEVVRNPHIWHFAFHAVPDLPEKLVAGQEALYFAFFYNYLAGPNGVSEELRERFTQAYKRREALHTGFEWYRAFAQDEKDNKAVKGEAVETPVLYLRGDKENFELAKYVQGFHDSGIQNLQAELIPNCGHFAPSEQPEAVLKVLREFIAGDKSIAKDGAISVEHP
jgi:pimeloyl-ACP methyl ester carboxylesterase